MSQCADNFFEHHRRAKPEKGSPCNGCGYCCTVEPCFVAKEFLAHRAGPCPAIELNADGYRCGVARNPVGYFTQAVVREYDSRPWQKAPETQTNQLLAAQISAVIGIGLGCEYDDLQAKDWPPACSSQRCSCASGS